MINDIQIEKLKSKLPIYLQNITQPDRRAGRNMYKCPLCNSGNHDYNNSNGAFSLTKDGKKWKCFGCGKGGDIFTLIEEYEGISDFSAQVRRAATIGGITLYKTHTEKRANGKTLLKHNLTITDKNSCKAYIEACKAAANKTNYFMNRGFSDDTVKRFDLGYDESKDVIVIPYDKDGSYYITRSVEGKNFRKPPSNEAGSEPIYNKLALEQDKPCFVCESPLDAISIIVAGEGSCNAVALGGTGHRKLIEEVKMKKPNCMLVLSFDADDAGQRATETVAEDFENLSIPFSIAVYSLEAYPEDQRKDANDFYRSNPEQLKSDIAMIVEKIRRAEDTVKEEQLKRYSCCTAFTRLADFKNGIKEGVNTFCVPTGFLELDEELDGGLYPDLYILGAISSLGKTTLLLQLADQIADQGTDVLYFSLEMAASELISKSISRYTFKLCNGNKNNAKTARGITTASRYRNYSQEEKDLIDTAIEAYAGCAKNLYIHEGIGDIGVEQIKQTVVEHEKITGNTPFVFVDYLQILAPYALRASDKQNTDKTVLELKRLARDHKTVVIGISSFNRDNYSTEVNMSAFKESGAIEYGSDVLLALQPQNMQAGKTTTEQKHNMKLVKDCKAETERAVEAVVLKNRNGKTGGKVGFIYYSYFNCFETDCEYNWDGRDCFRDV